MLLTKKAGSRANPIKDIALTARYVVLYIDEVHHHKV
jgi:hypothetical protein